MFQDWHGHPLNASCDHCVVVAANTRSDPMAAALADQLMLVRANQFPRSEAELALVVDEPEAWLQQGGKPRPGAVKIDFANATLAHRRKSGHNEPIGKAVGVRAEKLPTVFDATAGLGQDAYVLADLGCPVTLNERSPTLHYLLNAAVEAGRISSVDQVRSACERMTVLLGESTTRDVAGHDVIYLDPMFTGKRSSAAAKKELAALQILHGDVAIDEASLMEWALAQPVERIVIKRPAKVPHLAKRKPTFSIEGKAIRFDVISR